VQVALQVFLRCIGMGVELEQERLVDREHALIVAARSDGGAGACGSRSVSGREAAAFRDFSRVVDPRRRIRDLRG
jgi:hypothetical protein